jgi:signal transduction histidine kinase/CheY-like chemotaxis protein
MARVSAMSEKSGRQQSSKSANGRSGGPTRKKVELSALPPAVIHAMAESVAGARSPSEAIKDHLAIVHDLARARVVFVSTFEAHKGLLSVTEVRGRVDGSVVGCRPGEGAVGKAFASRAIVQEGAHLAVPLLEGARAVGVLSVLGARQTASAELWQAVASHLIAAMQAAGLRDSAVRRTRDLETAVAGLKSLDRAREELLGNVSHELKSPLTTIKAYLAMARRDQLGPLTDRQKKAFETCDRNADRLLRLINDMLLMSRLQSGRMTLEERPFALRALAQEAVGTLNPAAAASGVALVLEKEPEVYVKGDRERLLEALVHLLENGIIYNRPGGRVEVSIRAECGVALLSVRDDGAGIEEKDLPHIFERFYRGAGSGGRAGTGLGLSVVRQVAQLHGGSVSVQSALGRGSTFELRLPLFAGEVTAGSSAPEPRHGAVLVVEDDVDCREVLAELLASEGVSAIQAGDSDAALEHLATARPALILLDLRLGGSDGRAVLEYVRRDPRLERTPIFVISGAADSAAGFRYDGPERIDAFFEKPLNLPRLLDRVRAVVQPEARALPGAGPNKG